MLTEVPTAVSRYSRIAQLIATDRCVVLDGATGTELVDVSGVRPEIEEDLWGVTAIIENPAQVTTIHRRYVDAGCDVLSTNTWGLPTALRERRQLVNGTSHPVHWMDVARTGVRLARRAADEAGRRDEVAVAFSINGDVDTPDGQETLRLLARAFEDEPPDLILMETLSLVRSSTYATVERLLATGLPVWLSFRRCRHGVRGVYGEHWGGPEGDAFGRAARHFEEMGVDALLVNCVPPDHVTGMVAWLRDFTDLPLGVYPNLGYLSAGGWRGGGRQGGTVSTRSWHCAGGKEGAQIVGGCCGVGPRAHRSAREGAGGHKTGPPSRSSSWRSDVHDIALSSGRSLRSRGRMLAAAVLFPLDFPDLLWWTPGVSSPTLGQLSDLEVPVSARASERIFRCLDVGCGTGLLAIQMALRRDTRACDRHRSKCRVRNTMTNAFRNGVADRITAAAVDLFPWVPEERYDVIVASLYQMPVDPFEQVCPHRPLDYWGRNLIDHLIGLLPDALADDGVAYVMQLSIIGQQRTAERLQAAGLWVTCR